MNEHFKAFLESRFNESYIEEIKAGSEYNDLYAAYRHAYYQGAIDAIKRASEIKE